MLKKFQEFDKTSSPLKPIPMAGSLVILEGSLLTIFLLLQCMVALSLLKVGCYRYLCYSMDGSLDIMEGSLLSSFSYSNGW